MAYKMKMVFGKRRRVKVGGGGKKRRASSKKCRSHGILVHAGNKVFRVKKLTNCTAFSTGAMRCTVETAKEPVRTIRTFPIKANLPGVMGLGRMGGRRKGRR